MPTRRQIIDDRLYAHFVTFSVYRRRRLLDHDHPKRAGLVKRTTDWRRSSARWYEWRRSVGVPIPWSG